MRNLNEMTDEELALAYVEGDNKAFDLLLQRNEAKLFSYIMFVVHDENVANDIFQETFVKAIVKLQKGQYATNGKFGAWLMRIAHNVIVDGYRERKLCRMVDQRDNNDLSNLKGDNVIGSYAEREMVKGQVMEDVKRLVAFLPASQREIVYMRYYQQMSFKDIAENLFVIGADVALIIFEGLDLFGSEAECFEDRDNSVIISVAAADLDNVKNRKG